MFTFKRNFIFLLIAVLFSIIFVRASFAVTLPFRIVWERNTEDDLAFYTVYYGTSSRNYTQFRDVDKQENPHCDFCDKDSPDCEYTNAQVTPGTYYITVTATDFSLNESDFSTEFKVTIDPLHTTSTTTSIIGSTTTSPTTTIQTSSTTTSIIGSTTTSPTTTIQTSSTTTSIIGSTTATYENAEDGTTDRWYIYDDSPEGAEIANIFDDNRQSYVIEFSGSGTDNGYRLTKDDGSRWQNSNQLMIEWSMKYSELFTIFIDLSTTGGHRYLTYRPYDYNGLGDGEYVEHGLGTNAKDGQWHTFVRDLQADLEEAQPGVAILEVNGFLLRGSGRVDDISLLNITSPTTTTPIVSGQREYCSTDSKLVLTGSTPEEGTMSVLIPNDYISYYSLTYEDAEDGITERWKIYDNSPAGAEINNVFDDDRQSYVIQFSGSSIDNGYRLNQIDGSKWYNSSQFLIKWSMKYSELFTVYIDLETTAGHRYLQYRPYDYNDLGDEQYVKYGLGTNAVDGQWHTFVRDLQADLEGAQPGVTILEVNGFLIRGSGRVDDISLFNLEDDISATLFLSIFDSDDAGEGYIYINGNGPVDLPVGNYDNLEHGFEMPINVNWLIQGENVFIFTHVATEGYEVRKLCVQVLFAGSPDTTTSITTTIPPPPPPPPTTTTIETTSTTSIKPDGTPPTGAVIINNGDETTNSRIVTLQLSAEDDASGMGVGAQMMFSNDNAQWLSPKPFNTTKFWVLSPEEGEKTVYVRFSDSMGNWMLQPASDSIELEPACLKPMQLDTTAIESSGEFLNLWSIEKAVDEKTDTGWLSPLRLSMQDEYITIDLGETKIVNRIDICSNPFLFFDLFPLDFHIQVSTDNENWTEIFTVENYSPPSSYTDSWIFDETRARYVKMVTTKSKPFFFFFYLTYIAEIKVHGCSETETSSSQLTSMVPSVRTEIRVVKLTPDMEITEEKQPSINKGLPGRPGRPVFILNNQK